MPGVVSSRGQAPEAGATAQGCRNLGAGAGVYELQVRRRLLQQQLGVVDNRCRRVAQVVAKKNSAKRSRQEDKDGCREGISGSAGREERRFEGQGIAWPACNQLRNRRKEKDPATGGGLPFITPTGGAVGGRGNHDKNPAKTTRGSLSQQTLPTAAPFKKGGGIDLTNKRHMLREKQRGMEKEAEMERIQQRPRRVFSVRDEVPVVPSAFLDRYLRGEVPCSKHCSAGEGCYHPNRPFTVVRYKEFRSNVRNPMLDSENAPPFS